MTTAGGIIDPGQDDAARQAKRERFYGYLNKVGGTLNAFGLGFFIPIIKICLGDTPKHQLRELQQQLLIPIIGIGVFLAAWAYLAPQVQTSLGAVPGPAQVFEQVGNLYDAHNKERAKEEKFYARQDARNAKLIAAGKEDRVKHRTYTGAPTYLDQIWTSLKTVALGFIIATIVAVPLGIMCGLSRVVNGALNPLIQIFKPVSPLAWLPIVTTVSYTHLTLPTRS